MMRFRLTFAAIALATAAGVAGADQPNGFAKGTVVLKSAGSLAVGPDNVLFIGDAAAATVYAVATGDTAVADKNAPLNVANFNQKIGDLLGTMADQIQVTDLKVNPATGTVFVSVARGKGPSAAAVILRVDRSGKIEELSLKDVSFSKVSLPNVNVKNRGEVITGMAFTGGKLVVAGLSNEDFASTLRVVPFPFKDTEKGAGIEIFHGAHGRFETASPIRTFIPFEIEGKENILAAYTCTPLVKIPVADLKPGAKVRGTTVAELGNRNRPLDIITYEKGGETFLLMANSARGVMKIPTKDLGAATPITSPVKGGGPSGIKYQTIDSLKNVMQLDKLNNTMALLLVQNEDKSLELRSVPLP